MFFSPGRETHPTPHSLFPLWPPPPSGHRKSYDVPFGSGSQRPPAWVGVGFFSESRRPLPTLKVTWWHGDMPPWCLRFKKKWFRLKKKLEKYCTRASTIHLSGHNLWYLNLEDLQVYYFSRFSPPTNVALPGHPNVWSSQASKAKALVGRYYNSSQWLGAQSDQPMVGWSHFW